MAVESKKIAAIMGAIIAYIRRENSKTPQIDKTIAKIAKDKR